MTNTKAHIGFTIKSLADNADSPNGTFEAILSAPTLDRDGEVIESGAFNPLPASVPIYSDHESYTLRSIVGRATPYYAADGTLRLKGYFFSGVWAQEVRAMLNEGICTTMSCGFMSAPRKMVDGVPHITSAELLEGSFVGIPSNREALVTGSKAYADIEPPDGSFEARQEDVCEALEELYVGSYVSLLATWPDHVVYCVNSYPPQDTDGTFQVSYVLDVNGEVQLSGEIIAVEIQQNVVPEKAAKYAQRKGGARNSATDQTSLDQAHDMIVSAGANCPAMSDDGKAVEANPETKSVTETETETATETDTDLELEMEILEAELSLLELDE